ncbi:MAG: heavy-metal-associated domain-containing protein [Rhodobacteraceae bacterium]|nr:heavy-metal-associated domain-containing protein [Paracoccaceae bacterium]
MKVFKVPDMSCGHCTATIEKAVAAADNTAKLSFDLDARLVEIVSSLDAAALAAILESEGYPNSPV